MKKFYLPALALVAMGMSSQAQTTDRLSLIEGFTSNTCPPCYSWNQAYTPILEANNPNAEGNAGVAVLKFQMDWPSPGNDPSNNDDADTRRGFYGVTGIPDFYIDGGANGGSQADIDNATAVPAELEIQAAYTITGNTIDVNVEFTPLVDLGGGARLYIAVANKEYTYNGGTNGETEFHHVFRKMLGNDAGISLGFLNANDTQTFNESYTYTVGTPNQTNNNFWDDQIEIVVWVQRSNSKEVYNAAIATEGTLGIADGDSDDFGLLLFPNPAQDVASVVFDGTGEDVVVEVVNSLGQVVVNEQYYNLVGRQRLQLDTDTYEAGMYFVRVQMGNAVSTTPLMIAR